MRRVLRLLLPLALSGGLHLLALALVWLAPRLHFPAPPIPIEIVRTHHRAVEQTGAVEQPKSTQAPPPAEPKPAPSQPGPGARAKAPKPKPAPAERPPPQTTDLAPFAPDDAHLVVLLKMERLRASPHRRDAEKLLSALPDWGTLVDGSGVSPLDDLQALLIASADPRDVTATFLAARHADTPKLRALVGRRLSDGDPRVFRVVEPGLTVLARPEALGRDGGAEAAWLGQLRTFDRVGGGEDGPALLATLSDVPSLLRFGADLPTPLGMALALTAEASPAVRVRALFADERQAQAFAAAWPTIMGRYRDATALLGLATALDDLKVQARGAEVEIVGRIPQAQLELAIRWIEPFLPRNREAAGRPGGR